MWLTIFYTYFGGRDTKKVEKRWYKVFNKFGNVLITTWIFLYLNSIAITDNIEAHFWGKIFNHLINYMILSFIGPN